MRVWGKLLCAFLFAACLSSVCDRTTEAGVLELLTGDGTDQRSAETSSLLHSVAEDLTVIVEVTEDTVTETVQSAVSTVEEAVTVVDVVGSSLPLVLEKDLLTPQGLVETVNNVTDLADSAVGGIEQTLETAVNEVENIIRNMENNLTSTVEQLDVPDLIDGVAEAVCGASELVGGMLCSKLTEEDPEIPVIPDDPAEQDADKDEAVDQGETPNSQTEPSISVDMMIEAPDVHVESEQSSSLAEEEQPEEIEGLSNSENSKPSDNSDSETNHDNSGDNSSCCQVKPVSESSVYDTRGTKTIAGQAVASLEPDQSGKPKSPVPVQRKKIAPSVLPTVASVKQPVQSQSGSSGSGGAQMKGSPDTILADSISLLMGSRRIYAKNTRLLITKWANEPPTQPPKHFLNLKHNLHIERRKCNGYEENRYVRYEQSRYQSRDEKNRANAQ